MGDLWDSPEMIVQDVIDCYLQEMSLEPATFGGAFVVARDGRLPSNVDMPIVLLQVAILLIDALCEQ